MTETLFTDYKNQVDEYVGAVGFKMPEADEALLLQLKRLAHRNGASAAKCGMSLVMLCGGRFDGKIGHAHGSVEAAFKAGDSHIIREERVMLTEAGETALAQRDELKKVDSALALPVSSQVAAPEPLPALDPCSDDEPLPVFAGINQAEEVLPVANDEYHDSRQDKHRRPTGQDRKVPRK